MHDTGVTRGANVPADPFIDALEAFHRGDLKGAEMLCARIVAAEPRHFHAWHLRGVIAIQSGAPQSALEPFAQALLLDPTSAIAECNRGNALLLCGRLEEALASFDAALEREPDFADAHFNRGNALYDMARLEAALASYTRAIACQPDHWRAYDNLGVTHLRQGQPETALEFFSRSLAIESQNPDALTHQGHALRELRRAEAAAASYEAALALAPQQAEAWNGRGTAMVDLRRPADALDCFDRAFALAPGLKFLEGARLHTRMQLCDWAQFDADVLHLTAGVARGAPVCAPLVLAALSDSASLQRRAAETFVALECPPNPALPALERRSAGRRLKVGYFSADFGPHPVSYLMAGVFEAHDRSAFEVIGLSLGAAPRDPMRARLERAFERFVDVAGLPDIAIAKLARELELDIAVDLGGYTDGARPGIFALRAAPLQLGYIGFLGTLGAPYYDYLIADRILVPDASRAHYAESLLYLPNYQANDPQRPRAQARFTRTDLGLPAAGFVYCCCNAPYKITPRVFASWMRILSRVPGSVLLLNVSVDAARSNLRREAARCGVDPVRLVFAAALPYEEYLARYRCADLFLDTAPYNAGATASDALWAGLPVLTCPGEAFASRMAASVLTAAGLTELIAPTLEVYEELAVALAQEPARLRALRERCERLRDGARLFDARHFTAHLEAGLRRIHDLHLAGEPPRDVAV